MSSKRPRLSQYAHSAAWSIVELLCSTGAQFVLTPLLLHRLVAEQFGVWVIAQTVLVGSATLSLGAGTALMPVLAHARTRGDIASTQEAIRLFARRTLLMSAVLIAMVSITSGLGWAPATLSGWSRSDLWAIATAALLWAAVTELDNGLSSALKAQDRFDICALMEAVARTAQIALTFWLVVPGDSALVPIVLAAVMTATKAAVKFALLRPSGSIQDSPVHNEKLDRVSVASELKSNGLWIWLSVLSGLMFNAFDRWFVGAQLGSAVLVAYAACTQIAQMPHALVAAAGQTLGPWAAKRRDRLSQIDVRRNMRNVLLMATAAAALPSLILLPVLEPLLSLWISPDFAFEHLALARGMTLAFCLLALNVPAYFMLLGLGRVRSSTLLVALAGVVFAAGCLLMPPSLPGFVFMKGLFAALTFSLVAFLWMLLGGSIEMTTPAITCRTCGGHDTEDLGMLPDVASFAGVRLHAALHGGRLHVCRHCGFVFRDPILKDDEYLRLYSAGSADVWDSQDKRHDFELVHRLVPDAPIDVLDVGCYTGQLLAGLPPACRLHGIEPNAAAAAKAEARGVRIAAKHWENVGDVLHYDVITACDVVEHVGNPLEFLAHLATRLKPGGRVIVTTGNSEAWLWKQMRSRFWYCHYPEHISFIGPRWLSLMSTRAGLRVTRIERFSHTGKPGLLSTLSALAQMAIFFVSPLAYRNLHRRVVGTHDDVVPPPGRSLTKDHILCELVKV